MLAPYQPHLAGNREKCILVVAFVLSLISLVHHNNSSETKVPLSIM